MKKNGVKLADIAARTGFSVNTVSHALNDKPDISAHTKAYIKQVADEMGYIANASASLLRSGKSKSIAVIVGDVSNPHFAIMIKEIERMLRVSGYTAFIFNTDENEELERNAIKAAKSKSADGIILCPVQKSDKNIKFLDSLEIPYVLIGRHFAGRNTDYVVCDDENGGYLAAKHLLENNHRNILTITAPQYISSARERMAGIRRAFLEYGIEALPEQTYEFPLVLRAGAQRLEAVFAAHKSCTAVICFSDFLAMEAAYVLRSLGKEIPGDISIIGFDNIVSKVLFPLPLTSVTSSKTKMSKCAVESLLNKIEYNIPQEAVVLPTKLVKRESTKKI